MHCSNYAFGYCITLTSIVIPEGIEVVEDNAFVHCENLGNICLPSLNKMISYDARGNQVVSTLNKNENTSDNKIFTKDLYDGSTHFDIPDGYQIIGDGAFADCKTLQSITIPSSVTIISCEAFKGCSNLTSIFIPHSVSVIKNGAFFQSGIKNVDIDSSCLVLGDNWLSTTELQRVRINCIPTLASMPNYMPPKVSPLLANEIVFGTNISIIPFQFCSGSKTITNIIIESDQVTIQHQAFAHCTALETVTTIHQGAIKEIGSQAFQGCASLTGIDLSGATEIGSSAFQGCGIESINLSMCTCIGYDAFNMNPKLSNVKLSSKLKSIGWRAFENCDIVSFSGIQIDGSFAIMGDAFHGKLSVPDKVVINNIQLVDFGFSGQSMKYASINVGQDGIIPKAFFQNCSLLKSVTIEEGCTQISSNAFCGCSQLAKITLPSTIKRIEAEAFKNCKSLKEIILPNSLQSIGDNAFNGCIMLSQIILPHGLLEIGAFAFYECTSLKYIELPETVTKIGYDTFLKSGLESISWLSPHLNGLNCFRGETQEWDRDDREYYTLTIHSDICRNIKHIHFGHKVSEFPFDFQVLRNIETFSIDNPNLIISRDMIGWTPFVRNQDNWENGVLYYNHDVLSVSEDLRGKCVIKYGVKRIASKAFASCKKLTEIILPNTIEFIGSEAFNGCEKLLRITLPENLKRIASGAFRYCRSLTTVVGADDLEIIEADAFYGCEKLCYKFPDSLISIGSKAFSDTSIDSLPELPCLIELGTYAFSGSKISDTIFPSKIDTIPEGCFSNCKVLNHISLHNGLTSIEKDAFCNCDHLFTIDLPNSLISIGKAAFSLKSNLYSWEYEKIQLERKTPRGLTSITFPKSVTHIEDEAFKNCNQLSEVVFHGDDVELGINVFQNCILLSKIQLPHNIVKIPNETFSGCERLTQISLPETIQIIGKRSFSSCPITEISLPNSLNVIGEEAFAGTSLIRVSIPNNVDINEGAFSNCCALESIQFPFTLDKIPSRLLAGCGHLKQVDIPNSVTYIGDEAFESCLQLYQLFLPQKLEGIGEKIIANTPISQIIIPSSIKYLHDGAFSDCETLKYAILLAEVSEDWGTSLFPDHCKVFYGAKRVDKILRNIDNRKFNEWAAEAEDFERWCADGLRTAFEGDPEAMGGIVDW